MRGAPPLPGISRVLFLSTFLIATSGLIYELAAGALASYLVGDSVTWFSLVIGTYLSAMGVGSYLSRFVERGLVARFVEIELAVSLIGGFEGMILSAAFTWSPAFSSLLFGVVFLVGVGVGLELPLLIRILTRDSTLKELVARVLFLDYAGALVASVAFPLLLLPRFGLLRTPLLFGLVNAGVALATTFVWDAPPEARRRLRALSAAVIALLAGGLIGAGAAERRMDADLFADPVVFHKSNPYQRITLTHRAGDTRLFLNGALQFSTVDEHRYHEALVHPALAASARVERVLVLGGGDGLAAREVLRHPEVRSVTLVDLDPDMTGLFSTRPELRAMNGGSLTDPRVTVVNEDAFTWLRDARGVGPSFDVAVIDFPDPNDYALGKLYTTGFYRLLRARLSPGAAVAVQATSPFFSPDSFWCVVRTLEHEGLSVRPYHAYVPSFGEWGFALAQIGPPRSFRPLPPGLRFLSDEVLPTLFLFPNDLARRDGPVNRLDNQVLVRLYAEDWERVW